MMALKLPFWLEMEESYLPPSDKDTFINKSIYAFLHILSRMKAQGSREKMFGISVSLQLVCVLMLILLIAISHKYIFVFIANIYILLLLSLMNGEEIIKILKVNFIVVLFSGVVLLPSVFLGNHYSIVIISAKIFATVTAVNILSHSAPWHELTGSMKRFYIPDMFIFVLDITLKYIYLLGEFSLSMLYALKIRSIGKNKDKHSALSGIAGTIFLRSVEMSQEMYSAMECRGFTGKYTYSSKIKISIANIIYLAVNGLLLFTFFYFRSYD
jgi:cobalt/nickel transport system permease protein